MILLREKDSGSIVEVAVGSIVTVCLTEIPSSGYRWVVETAGKLEEVVNRFEVSGQVGAAGTRVFQFRTNHVGLHELCMKNWREWEGAASIIARFNARILVK